MIKIGNLDIDKLYLGTSDNVKVYLGDVKLYPSEQPSFQGKWLATYSDSSTTSADCDSTSAITQNEIESGAGLISVLIGDCVTNIDNNAFVYKSALSTVTIGSGVTRIGNYAFYSCTSLASITINAETPPSLGSYALNYTNDCPIYVPAESVAAYQSSWSAYSSRIQANAPQWVTFNYGDDISGLDIYGVSGISEDLADTFGGGDIQFTPSRTDIECNIGYCYGDTFARGEIVELIFSNLGCNDYYNSSATNVEGGTIQLYIYD